jgi:hypothetical protein
MSRAALRIIGVVASLFIVGFIAIYAADSENSGSAKTNAARRFAVPRPPARERSLRPA